MIVVADDDDILVLIALRLERRGYDVVSAHDGEEALRLIFELKPDLAVLDVMMPGLDGYELTRRIRQDEATSRTPVILVTARVNEADVSRGIEAGADDYIGKPFSPKELSDRVQRVLERPPRPG